MPPFNLNSSPSNPLLEPPPPPPADAPPPPHPKRRRGSAWDVLSHRATIVASVASLFLALVVAGAVAGYYYSQSRRPVPTIKSPAIQSLSPSDLAKLGQIGATLGQNNQVLSVAADALFRGQADVVGNLTVGGRLNANGPVTLSQLNITGTTAATGLNVGSNLNVTGTTTLQNTLAVSALATLQSLTVSGATNLNSVNAVNLTVHNISISGPLTIGHIVTQGPAPAIAAGAVGSGGTVSISGNDTSGQVNINLGSGPGVDVALATITFKAVFGATAHVQLTPINSAAAQSEAFVTPTNSNFQIRTHTPVASQSLSSLSFDYLVVQ